MREDDVRSGRVGPSGSEDGGQGSRTPADAEKLADLSSLPRKERERAMHREAILNAARTLLGRKSYDQITVQEIAAEAEFSVGYIYKIFADKEDIYVALIREMGEEMMALLQRGLADRGSFEDRLTRLIDSHYEWLNANPAFTVNHIFQLHSLSQTLPRLEATHREREEALRSAMRPFLEAGLREGVIEGDVDLMEKTIKALTWGFVGDDLLHGEKSGEWARYTPIVVRAFLRTFAPEDRTEPKKEAPSK